MEMKIKLNRPYTTLQSPLIDHPARNKLLFND